MSNYIENILCMAELYLKNGIPLVLYHGITPEGECSCFEKEKCKHPGKHPVFKNPAASKITNISDLKRFLKEGQFRNLAAMIESGSRLFVIDVDKKNGGLESYEKFIADFGYPPKTTKVLTGGGGFHLYFRLPTSFWNQKIPIEFKKYKGIEFFTNKNIVIPGSRHFSKNIYKLDDSEESASFIFAEIPEKFLIAIQNGKEKGTENNSNDAFPDSIPEGSRNNSMFKLALELLEKNDAEDIAWQLLQSLNSTKCKPALDDAELLSIFESAKKRHANSCPYYFYDGYTYYKKDGIPQRLGNFHIVLQEQLKIDDGSGDAPSIIYVLKIHHPKIYPDIIKVTPEQLENGSYLEKTDARLILQNLKQKDHLRKAVRLMGNTDACQDIKIHTGWIKYKDQMVFLSNSGAIGADGINKDLKTHEDYGGPSGYTLNLTKQQSDFTSFGQILLNLLSVSEPQVTYPLLAAAFRAPLYSMSPTDFAVGVIGKTGSMKSTIAALFLGFFGSDFSVSNLPENFGSTPNSIERRTFLHKDVVLVIDDFVVGEISTFNAERIFRSIGNRSGRGRLTKDITLRTSYIPRGLIVFTGEDMNLRQSIRARMILVYSEAQSINKKVLTDLQRISSQGVFSQIMGEYIKWLAPNYEKFQATIKEEIANLLEIFQSELLHNRIAPNLSNLFIGIKFFNRFCVEKNILSANQTQEIEQEALEAFKSLVRVQLEHQIGSDPIENFLMCLRGAIETNKAHIKIEQESLIKVLGKFLGYKNLSQISNISSYQPMGEKIGLIKKGELWLLKDKTMLVIKEYARNRSVKFDISENMLGRHLRDGGWLIVDDGRANIKRTFEPNHRPRCWVFNNWMDVLEPDIHESIKNADNSTKAMLEGLFGAPIAPFLSSSSSPTNQTAH